MADTTPDVTNNDADKETTPVDEVEKDTDTGEESDTDTADADSDVDDDEDDEDEPVELDPRSQKKINKVNREAKNLREAKKALEAQLDELKVYKSAKDAEDAAKLSDLEKMTARVAELEAQGTKIAREAAEELALEKLGVTAEQLEELPGNTFAEIKAAFDKKAKVWGGKAAPKPKATNLTGGTDPEKSTRDSEFEEGRKAAMNMRLF